MKDLGHLNYRLLLETRRFLLLAIGCGVLVIGIVLFGVIPQVQAALELNDQRQAEDKRLKLLAKKASDLESMNNSPLLGQIKTVNQVLPSKKPLLELMASLGAASQATQVTITRLDLSPGTISTDSATAAKPAAKTATKGKSPKNAAVSNLTVNIVVEGELGDLESFFSTMENRAPLSTITNISLSKKSALSLDITENDPFEAEVTISSAYFTQSVTSAVEASLPSISQQQELLLKDLEEFVLPLENQQQQIEGGGLNDLFGITQPELEQLGITQEN
jgi:hypothetical protein